MNRNVIERLFAKHRPAFLRHALRIVHSVEDAEDCVSEAVVKALAASECRDDFETDAHVLNWLFVILRNHCINWRRYRKHTERVESEDEWDALAETDKPGWLSTMLLHEARYRLRHTALTDSQRKCLQGRLAGYSYVEIGKQVGLKEEGVRSALYKATKALRACPFTEDLKPTGAEFLFWYCSQVAIYRAPTKTGTALSNARVRRMR